MKVTDSICIKQSVEVILTKDMPRWLVDNKLSDSMGEARRLLAQGAVRVIRADGTTQVVKDEKATLRPGDKIKIGKRYIFEIRRGQ